MKTKFRACSSSIGNLSRARLSATTRAISFCAQFESDRSLSRRVGRSLFDSLCFRPSGRPAKSFLRLFAQAGAGFSCVWTRSLLMRANDSADGLSGLVLANAALDNSCAFGRLLVPKSGRLHRLHALRVAAAVENVDED